MTFEEKLAAIRTAMKQQGIDAYIIPSSDPHTSEYLPEHYKCLLFVCGFTGSQGTLVITEDFAGLWADFRYFEQAEDQLKGSGYQLVKLKVQHTPEYIDWLFEKLPEGAVVGFDEALLSVNLGKKLKNDLSSKRITLKNADLLSSVWLNRPALPSGKAFMIKDEDAGQSVNSKLESVRTELKGLKSDYLFISALDEVAWVFNLRGHDVPFNPVVLSFALIGAGSATLFIDPSKLDDKSQLSLHSAGVEVLNYNAVNNALLSVKGCTVFIDPARISYFLFKIIEQHSRINEGISPVAFLKARKNETEIKAIKSYMVKDGVAMTRFCKWIEDNIGRIQITELSASEKLKTFRAEQEGFAGVSFTTIGGYNAHAALPHYTPSPETDTELRAEGLFLVDSGGQYHYGTTDITRMIPLGPVSEQAKTDYTLVLKALIEGTCLSFPKGTCGYQIDSVIRKPLWEYGINYGHGTGHGVGFYLNVHEGPQNIGPANVPVAIQPGMITSIEPGIYRPGLHGVRIENLVLAVPDRITPFSEFIRFETVTLAYIDTSLVRNELLEPRHIKWLNDYNEQVYQELVPFLTAEEEEWLRDKISP
ncbi:Xaa-Pro aminopeptidase [Pararcticibacter amylolyticus]|uniref:Xaa-Pro aminopeptidase n=2 Tax=Pararcticibacter amylolyticus TaxID=2173175 RepID=A0A2U2PKG1_9SPHI|nr:Xaa-Pro aminopeptidase [Pararcticibacter amylolyticus]